MEDREDALATLDRVEFDLGQLEYRQNARARHQQLLRHAVVGVVASNLLCFFAWQGADFFRWWQLRKWLGMGWGFVFIVGCMALFFGALFVAAQAMLSGTKDVVEREMLLRERRKVLEAQEVRGALHIHSEVDDAHGGLSIHEDTKGRLTTPD